jgi:quercetin dioxygenase-like cupin family protein
MVEVARRWLGTFRGGAAQYKGDVTVKKNTLGAALVVLAGLSSFAPSAPAADKGTKVGGGVLIPVADVKWSEVPGMTGVQIAPVEGDPSKGPSHFFLKFASGFAAPLHHHTANHSGTVVTGTLALTVDGKEQKLPPGSFFAFAGKTKHATRCETGADCVLSMDVRGKWDVVPEGDKGGGKK